MNAGTISERVDRGVAWLDDGHPGWADRIDLSKFEMNNCVSCVMGQLEGSFMCAWAKNNPAASHDDRLSFFVDRGFYALASGEEHSEYDALQEEWQRRIVRRRLEDHRRLCDKLLSRLTAFTGKLERGEPTFQDYSHCGRVNREAISQVCESVAT